MEIKRTGQTKDVGFQLGVRKTLPVSVETAWDFLFSDKGMAIWLGPLVSGELSTNKPYQTVNGIEGVVKVLKPLSHIRLSWKKKGWADHSTVQVRVINNKGRATISFHQEKLLDSKQREEMLKYWSDILARIVDAVVSHQASGSC
ncbi:activator of Hsp90 ATPase-like protein [Chitinophaga niastensis]|uniref:Activator of Hsp90 ATPase-like protein n=1 Tax=Chitinophaga niastensis TaxID=536980 RepID=A0A2P8HJB8_CHINA|nr:SRPBCC domain-containing protein [Chitinophaga niastensis]PSL46317.1 activator of Hsp90 ATPase-like protein [Chitinophaga niastensis]